MDESWAYLGVSTKGADVVIAAARPTWSLSVGGRRPRGEWTPSLEWLERVPRADLGPWLQRRVADPRGPVWESRRLRLLVDIGRYGEGDLLRSIVERAFDRWIVLRQRVQPVLIDVVDRDVLRAQRPDGILSLPRRELLASLIGAAEAEQLTLGRGPLFRDLIGQLEEVQRRPEPGAPAGSEELLRAAGLTVWAISREGGGRLRGFGDERPLAVH